MKAALHNPLISGLAAILVLSTAGTALAYGEGSLDLPNLEERAVHLFTDRLRVDPDATDAEFAEYPPVAPLMFNSDLAEAARFHADDMAVNGCFQHESCDGTEFGARLQRYYSGFGYGENIALGSPDAHEVVFDGWLYSPPHRDNMLHGDWRELGTGFAQIDAGPPLWVQDFGMGSAATEPITTSATHWPLRPAEDEEVTFYLAGYDPEGTPQGARLFWALDEHQMDDDRGSDGMQTWSLSLLASEALCHPYFFILTRADGSEITYPTDGSLLVPVGGSECDVWRASRPDSNTGCPSSADDSRYSATGCVGDPDRAGGPDDNVSNNPGYSNCTLAPQPRRSTWAVLAVLLLQLRRRRR